jgi:hypothetical protein
MAIVDILAAADGGHFFRNAAAACRLDDIFKEILGEHRWATREKTKWTFQPSDNNSVSAKNRPARLSTH